MPVKANASANVLLMPVARAPVLLRTQKSAEKFDVEGQANEIRLWDLHPSLHCSIIGTCLTAAELRQILKRAGLSGLDGSSDHDLHSVAVGLCCKAQTGSKFLNKTLNRKHRVIVKRFAAAKTADEINSLWREFLEKGDIPGAYWALLTHPASDEAVVRRAFADVHMLSHLVGASNRADIRRLRQLEEGNNALMDKVERQAARLRGSIAERDRRIAELTAILSNVSLRQTSTASMNDGSESELVAELDGRLRKQAAHALRLEERLKEAAEETALAQAERAQLLEHVAGLKAEMAALEALTSNGASDSEACKPSLGEKTVLYVGGRPNQMPQFRTIAEEAGACFLHHDGGIEENSSSLAALVARADAVLFPVDCVSHRAVTTVKRVCAQLGKDYYPMRSSGLSSFAKVLHVLSSGRDYSGEIERT